MSIEDTFKDGDQVAVTVVGKWRVDSESYWMDGPFNRPLFTEGRALEEAERFELRGVNTYGEPTCKHCGEEITNLGGHHTTGPTKGLQSCAELVSGLPYGYRAGHPDQACLINCLGYEDPEGYVDPESVKAADADWRDILGREVFAQIICTHEFEGAVCETCWESMQRICKMLVQHGYLAGVSQ